MKKIGTIGVLAISLFVCGRMQADEIKVRIFQPDARKAYLPIYSVIESAEGMDVGYVSVKDATDLSGVDVLIVPQVGGRNVEKIKDILVKWVEQGGGLMTIHDAVGYRSHPAMFPDVAKGLGNPYNKETGYGQDCIVSIDHPVTEGLKPGEVVEHTYFDQVVMEAGKETDVIAREAIILDNNTLVTGGPVMVAARVGKGRYIANGFAIGYGPGGEATPTGGELSLFLNGIRWLASTGQYDAGEDIGIGVKAIRTVGSESEKKPYYEEIAQGSIVPCTVDWRKTSGREAPPTVVESAFKTPIEFDEKALAGSGYDPMPADWNRIDLGGAWKIRKLAGTENNPAEDEGMKDGFYKNDFDDKDWARRPVPSSWDNKDVMPEIEGDVGAGNRGEDFTGVGWYRRNILIPESARGKRVVLCFDGCDYETKLWVNGKYIGRHVGGRTPFEFDCTEAVECGKENCIAVRVYDIDRMARLEHYPEGYPMYSTDGGRRLIGGIWGETYFSVRPDVYGIRTLITPRLDSSEIEVDCMLNNTGDARDVELKARIIPAPPPLAKGQGGETEVNLGGSRLASGMNARNFRIKMKDPVLWTPDNPYLYVFELTDGKHTIAKARFGFREFSVGGHYFYLNGKKVYLRSTSLRSSTFFMKPRIEIEDEANFMTRFLLGAKSYNCNMIYTWTAQHPRKVYDLCDELGLLVYREWDASAGFFNNPEMEDGWNKGESEIDVWICDGYNHPSIVMYSLGGELMEYNTPKPFKSYNELLIPVYDLIKSIDKQNRPVCSASGRRSWTRAEDKTDIYDLHFYAGGINRSWTDETGYVKNLWRVAASADRTERPLITFELGGHRWYNKDLAAMQALFDEEKRIGSMNRKEFVDLLQKRPQNYVGARWISNLYGGRRYVDDIGGGKGWREYVGYQIYAVKNVGEEIRRLGPLMQAYNPNTLAFDMTEVMEDGELFPGVAYGAARIGGDLAKKTYVESEAYRTFQRVNNPEFVCLDVFDKNVFAGGELDFNIYAVNDIDELSRGWRVRVVIRDEDGRILDDREADIGKVEGFKRNLVPYAYSVPTDAGTGFYRIELFMYEGKTVVSDNYYDFFVLGKADLAVSIPTKRKVALYDVRDKLYDNGVRTKDILEDLGVSCDTVKDFNALVKYDVLIIGADSMDNTVMQAGDRIRNWIEQGGVLLQFEQHIGTPVPYWRKLRVFPGKEHIIMEIIELNHPVFKGLHYLNMERWSNLPGTATPGEIFSLTIGPLDESVLACGNTGVQPRLSTRSTNMIISEVDIGKGKLLMTQTDATQRYDSDSVATKLIVNMLEYVLGDTNVQH